MKICLPDIM